MMLSALELITCVFIVTLYRYNYKPDWYSFLSSPPGWLCAVAGMGVCTAASLSIWRARALSWASLRRTVIRNGLIAALVIVPAEFSVRWLAFSDLAGQHIGKLLLRPRDWDAVVDRYSRMLDQFESAPTFFVTDPILGWTVGKERRSLDGLLISTAEGIRSPAEIKTYVGSHSACRVAVVGDSFALAERVQFHESWGARLEGRLKPDCQVLNFGVSGYSIGQMFLRFKQDILPWHPDVVVVAFTDGALSRTMGMYGFLVMTDWECPWAQPRFTMDGPRLVQVNSPLPQPREIFSRKSILELPYISYDRWYLSSEWEQRYWDLAYKSYGFRLVTSLYPLFETGRAEVSEDALWDVNTALIRSLQELAAANGTEPIIAYLPTREDLKPDKKKVYTPALMEGVGGTFVDATMCLKTVEADERFVINNSHYSATGNQAIADCLLPDVQHALAKGREHSKEKVPSVHG
ncbi:hypothetical protein W02_12640 [Nitrospira sp. KM1]|uniref:SGNH/GDSL hydrolase family protein n=1 Tax=Nitrospira sp. KM1 TaxID=1936990 RepID=UPI0013A771B5|nr:SGNH/GDSL hydrolase family protein [Nitrospira sp. KM1]BCA54124.1 hypothetical protein W02_12640 [Nitrospira sp. KM1]